MANLNENLTRLSDARDDIAEAIVNKGGTVGRLDGFEDFSTDIASITNQYTVADEGKVVSNGQLVTQTTYPSTITENGTYDTTLNNSVVVDVSGGVGVPTKKTWTGLTNFDGAYVWTDGTDIYYSKGSSQYVLDRTTSTWTTKTWNGLESFDGNLIWSDGDNIYYSKSSTAQKVLDKNTSTWNDKTWNGATPYGTSIWTDGDNIYYSSGNASYQYILDKNTSTWTPKTWTGLTSFQGSEIWTDGENIYRSSDSAHYKLNKSTSTWTKINFSGSPTNPDARYIWHAGGNTYYSNVTSNPSYLCSIFDKDTLTWTKIGIEFGSRIWYDGENVYYSYGGINTIIK